MHTDVGRVGIPGERNDWVITLFDHSDFDLGQKWIACRQSDGKELDPEPTLHEAKQAVADFEEREAEAEREWQRKLDVPRPAPKRTLKDVWEDIADDQEMIMVLAVLAFFVYLAVTHRRRFADGGNRIAKPFSTPVRTWRPRSSSSRGGVALSCLRRVSVALSCSELPSEVLSSGPISGPSFDSKTPESRSASSARSR